MTLLAVAECAAVATHSRRGFRRAMAHPGRLFAELGFPVTPVLPHILARTVNASDFQPSRFLSESPRSLPIGIIGGRLSVVQSKPIATQSWRLSAVLGVRTKRHLICNHT